MRKNNTSVYTTWLLTGISISMALIGCKPAEEPAPVSIEETRAIAKEAYLWGFPMVESYKALHAQAVDSTGSDFRAPFNQIGSAANVFTPQDTAIVTPNSDTPYSFMWMDLRAEPLVLTIPKIDKDRYFSVQLIDLYTHNFDYLGSRTTGNDGGIYLIAGPDWRGEAPSGIAKVIRPETQIAYAIFRTQLFGEKDLDNVRQVLAGYLAQPLSTFLGSSAPPAAPTIDFPAYDADSAHGVGFFSYLNFLMQFEPLHPSEVDLRRRFSTIGIVPGRPFDGDKLTPESLQALLDGIADAEKEFAEFKKTKLDTQVLNSADLFGTRELLKNNYLYRYAGARLGIFGNSGAEANYEGYFTDADGQALDASQHAYTLHFAKGGLPPTQAFWSLTMYDGKNQLLVDNPLNRYLINSPMLSSLKPDADGGLTIYIQSESPGKAREANWLPAPKGPFMLALRYYWPKPELLNDEWKTPQVERVK